MPGRNLSSNMDPASVAECNGSSEGQIVPIRGKQPAFRDAIASVQDNANHVASISVWGNKEPSAASHAKGYAKAPNSVASLMDGTPKVRASSAINSTVEASAALATAWPVSHPFRPSAQEVSFVFRKHYPSTRPHCFDQVHTPGSGGEIIQHIANAFGLDTKPHRGHR